ncbi:MAG: hypothetical protein HPY72_05695 [Anaerolineae bacterium]|nr:hypothetical protein [Anaerolineae bacterium]
MSAPFIWIVLPIAVSLLLLVIRKNYALANLIQVMFCFLMVFFTFITRIEERGSAPLIAIYLQPSLVVLGRSFVLIESQKFIVGLFYTVLGAWSLILFLKGSHSKIIPLGLTLTSLLLAAMAVEPFQYSALIVEVAMLTGILIAFSVDTGKSKGIVRVLIFYTMGMAFILLAGWYLAGGETSPVNDQQLTQASLLLGMGFVFWLGVFPFHSWIPLIADESELPDSTYVLTVLPLAIILILLKYLNGFAWLRESQLVYQALFLFGAVMTLTGSVWSVFQNRIKKMIGYLTIYFNGLLLIALGLNSSQGYLIFPEALLPRLLSVFLAMTSLLIISDRYRLENLADMRSLFYEYPFSSMGFLISLFTMIGMPLSNGFLPLQSLYQATALNHLPILVIMLCGAGILTFSFIRLFMVIMHPIEDDYEIVTRKESRTEKIVIALLVILNVLSGLLPKMIFPSFAQIMNSFDLLLK